VKKNLGIYVHIPFCAKKCKYCDFLSSDKDSYGTQLRYMEAICQEIRLYKAVSDRYIVRTIFIGGGTPSLVDENLIQNILTEIRSTFEMDRFPEITIEANPGTIMYQKLLAYRSMGINRISIGLQSADDKILSKVGRIHNFDQFVAGYTSARRAGFKNINVDIMASLPGQDIHSYVDTLTRVIEYEPEHISAYSLTVEEGTPLSCDNRLLSEIPDEETDRRMYSLTKKVLGANGFNRYEFSNYSKPGYECRHNITYWTGGEYIGFGIGASSYFQGKRFSNIRNIHEYTQKLEETQMEIVNTDNIGRLYETVTGNLRVNVEPMYIDRRMEEFMFLGLRMVKGIDRREFYRQFNRDIYDVYGPTINKYIYEGFMETDGTFVKLTDSGIDVSNYILSDFILDK